MSIAGSKMANNSEVVKCLRGWKGLVLLSVNNSKMLYSTKDRFSVSLWDYWAARGETCEYPCDCWQPSFGFGTNLFLARWYLCQRGAHSWWLVMEGTTLWESTSDREVGLALMCELFSDQLLSPKQINLFYINTWRPSTNLTFPIFMFVFSSCSITSNITQLSSTFSFGSSLMLSTGERTKKISTSRKYTTLLKYTITSYYSSKEHWLVYNNVTSIAEWLMNLTAVAATWQC